MNKKEAIEKIEKLDEHYGISEGVYLEKRDVVSIISQIDEPQKVVVPKCIADLIKELKIGGYTLGEINENIYDDEEQKWIDDNEELFYRAWLDCHTVEKEKLYTVEIPKLGDGGG
jgi:hypothetical protein